MSNKSLRRRQYKTTGSSALTDGQISSLVEQLLSKHGDDYAPLNEVLTKLAQSVDTMGAGEVPLTFSTGSTRTVNTITINLSTGKAGSQSVIGGTAASETLTLSSTAHATKGKVLFGDSAFNEATNILGIGTASPTLHKIVVADTILAGSGSLAGGLLNMTQTWNTSGTPTAIFLNVTDTASNAASKLIDLQVGAVSQFSITKAGALVVTGAITGTDHNLSAAGILSWTTRGSIRANADGVFQIADTAGTSFGRLQFGGTTSSFPALKRSTTILQARLADDSDYAPFSASIFRASGSYQIVNSSLQMDFRNGDATAIDGIYRFNRLATNSTHTSGTTNNIKTLNTQFTPSGAGSGSFNVLDLVYVLNGTAGAQTGTATGILIEATETTLNGMLHNLIDLKTGGTSRFTVDNVGNVISAATVRTAGYTVVTLPATPTQGDRAFVTDATAPTYGAVLVGGGAVVVPVFYNGAAWVSA